MKKLFLKIVSIIIGIILISVILPIAEAENIEDIDFSKGMESYKGVYDRGKPSGTPGGGNSNKPDKPGDEEPAVDKWAVVIGIADYQGIGNDLQYTDDDAMDMYDYLIAQGYPKGNIKLLLNRKATGRNIYSAIDWMASQEGPDSECVFFYSGHGSTYDGYNDGDDEYTDEAIVVYELKLILDGFLRDAFSGYESSKIAFIFDSCFSGGMDDLAGPGRVVVTGGAETQLTYDGPSTMQNGVFSYYFFEGLNIYNTIEEAYTYSAPLAYDFVNKYYEAEMDPQLFDQYTGYWTF